MPNKKDKGSGYASTLTSRLFGWARGGDETKSPRSEEEGETRKERKSRRERGANHGDDELKRRNSRATERPTIIDPWKGGRAEDNVWTALQLLYQHGFRYLTFLPDAMEDVEETVIGIGETLSTIEKEYDSREKRSEAEQKEHVDQTGVSSRRSSRWWSMTGKETSTDEQRSASLDDSFEDDERAAEAYLESVEDALFVRSSVVAFPLLLRAQGHVGEGVQLPLRAAILYDDSRSAPVRSPTSPREPSAEASFEHCLSLRLFEPALLYGPAPRKSKGERRGRRSTLSESCPSPSSLPLPSPAEVLLQSKQLFESMAFDGDALEIACGDFFVSIRISVLEALLTLLKTPPCR